MGMKVWKYAGNTTNLHSHHENSAKTSSESKGERCFDETSNYRDAITIMTI